VIKTCFHVKYKALIPKNIVEKNRLSAKRITIIQIRRKSIYKTKMVQYEQFIRGGKTKFEDTKGVIMNPKSKKNRQCNGHKKKDKQRPTNHYAEEQKYGYAKLINRHSNISDGQETLRRACTLYFT
jgi:phage/plasmid-associated DNA primase